MYKNVLLIAVAAMFFWACGGQNTANTEQTTEQEEVVVVVDEPTAVTVANFKEKAGELIDKEVIIEGTVTHVCKHGGKKMFIMTEDPDVNVKIVTGEETASFDPELEGSYIKVHGIVEAIEVEVEGEGQLHEGEDGVEHVEDEAHQNIYHVPQYSVICIDYTVEEADPSGE